MFGFKDLEINILNEKQLLSLAGGIQLKLEIMNQTAEFKKTKKTGEALAQIFYQDKEEPLPLAFRMMVYLA